MEVILVVLAIIGLMTLGAIAVFMAPVATADNPLVTLLLLAVGVGLNVLGIHLIYELAGR